MLRSNKLPFPVRTRFPVSPLSPKIWMNTLASVPALGLSPVIC
jgi:hypothetical protein